MERDKINFFLKLKIKIKIIDKMNEKKYKDIENILTKLFIEKENINRLDITQFNNRGDVIIKNAKPYENITHIGFEIEYVYIMLMGSLTVLGYSNEGKKVYLDESQAPQILGLYEILSGNKKYSASLTTIMESVFLGIKADLFKKMMIKNSMIAYICSVYLSTFITYKLEKYEYQAYKNEYTRLMVLIYYISKKSKLPNILNSKKDELALRLGVSERTIYRYLKKLEENHFIRRQGRKLIVDESNYKAMEDFLSML